jgi:hypothetical protein
MIHQITDAALLATLKEGVKKATDVIARVTDYRGGPVTTEYLLTADIELSPKVGDGGNREGGISWGCLTPPFLHRRSDMPCLMITLSD